MNQPPPATESPSPATSLAGRFSRWNGEHPVWSIILVSFLAVVINCYPIIFCGRSFVSPSWSTQLVYSWWPTVPGAANGLHQINRQGSDTGAMLWQDVPISFMESRSVMQGGELPLWDRYGHAGSPFIGQAVTMLGDPLQWIVILGGGSALAWDVKFLTAKFLFCVGFGLLIRRLMGDGWLGPWYSVLAAYAGAFFYIKIHPVFFVFGYAPWILLSAMRMLETGGRRGVGWWLAWLVVNFGCFNAGHVEVAVDLIGGLNLAALVYALGRRDGMKEWRRVAVWMGLGTVLFVGLTAPVWMSFLVAQMDAYSVHTAVKVRQIPLAQFPGVFDTLNLLLWWRDGFFNVPAPSCSLLLVPGCIYAVWHWRRLRTEPFFWINSAAILGLFSLIFLPFTAPLLRVIPFLNRVGHTDTDFCYLLVLHLTIQSAYGFKCLMTAGDFRRAARQLAIMGSVLVGGMFLYGWVTGFDAGSRIYILSVTACAAAAPWLAAFWKSRLGRISLAGWVEIAILAAVPLFRFGFYHTGDDSWLMIPGPRVKLNASSPALQKIQRGMVEPFRVVGMEFDLAGDYAATYGLEDIRSCLPLSNRPIIELMSDFPGINFTKNDWEMQVDDPVKAQPLLNLLNVKYVLDRPKAAALSHGDLRVVDRSDFTVMENPEAWPRAFFDNKIIRLASNQEFTQYLLDHGRKPFVTLTPAEIEKQSALNVLETIDPLKTTVIPATHYELGVNATAFDIHATSAGMACLTEGQAKDFIVRVNGQPGQVLTVNRAFKGVYLAQPGDYHVVFTYRPRYWPQACLSFGLSMLVCLIIAVAACWRGRGRPESG